MVRQIEEEGGGVLLYFEARTEAKKTKTKNDSLVSSGSHSLSQPNQLVHVETPPNRPVQYRTDRAISLPNQYTDPVQQSV